MGTTAERPDPFHLLVVDASPATRATFATWLRRGGYAVHHAASGREALVMMGQHPFDLVLLDVHLPDMTGLEVCERIKANRVTAGIPVVHVSTAGTDPRDRISGLTRGADGYLSAPIEREELLAIVSALLRYHEARRTAERLATRLERLHQATLLMNAAVSVPELSQFAASGLLTLFGAPVGVFLARDASGRLATAAPNDIEPAVRLWDPQRILQLAQAAQSSELVEVAQLPASFSAATKSATAVAAPIATPRGELVGAVVLLVGAITPEDALLLDHFSQALAVALENQRLYDVEHRIALTLQRAMLPQSLPRTPGLEVAVSYQAASDTVEIGGDFYEVLALAPDRTLLAIGDVAGHSLHAATVMAELRYSLRAFAAIGLSAPEIIDRLSAILIESHPDLIATLCIVEVDLSAETVLVTNAGHVPPMVRSGDQVTVVQEHGPLLGLRAAQATPTACLAFPPGAVVVLTTDGLVERPREDLAEGLQRLERAILAHGDGPVSLCDRLIQDVTEGVATVDDIAILAARHAPGRVRSP